MLPELLLESIHFLDRECLEACQNVSRAWKTTIDKSNATLALRPMGTLIIQHCTAGYRPRFGIDCAVQFHSSDEGVPLKIGISPCEAAQTLAIAQEMVARTRNMLIDRLSVRCIECSAPFFALWRDAYDDGRLCKVSSVILDTSCTLTVDVKALLQPFMSSKLGVTSCEVTVCAEEWNDGMFDALWSACDGCMAQSLKFYAHCRRSFLHLLERLLAASAHCDRHFSLVGIVANLQGIAEKYIEKFEAADTKLNFPTSLFIGSYARQDQPMYTVRHPSRHTLEKPPAVRNWYGSAISSTRLESPCNVYETKKKLRAAPDASRALLDSYGDG